MKARSFTPVRLWIERTILVVAGAKAGWLLLAFLVTR